MCVFFFQLETRGYLATSLATQKKRKKRRTEVEENLEILFIQLHVG